MSLNLTMSELRPMAPDAQFAGIVDRLATIEISNPRHFARTLQFAEENGLIEEFSRPFIRLLHLLVLRPEGRISPDGPDVPSFIWSGAGMVGGFIFHRSSRDWSIHT